MFTEDLGAHIQRTRSQLKSWGGRERFAEGDGGYWEVELPAAQGADYHFIAYIYADGEVQSLAKREGAPEGEYFWYKSYEKPDYDSIAEMHSRFLSELETLLTSQTRITHEKGLLFGSFECAYRIAGHWKSIGGTSYLRLGGFRPPSMKAKRQEYLSDPVCRET